MVRTKAATATMLIDTSVLIKWSTAKVRASCRGPALCGRLQLDDLHAILGPSLVMTPLWLLRAAMFAHTHTLSFDDAS